MRADAQKNYTHLIGTARVVIAEQGADASLRDIARRAGVGLGTLYRHFPTREALLEALLHSGFAELTDRAANLEASDEPQTALAAWLGATVAFSHTYRGVTDLMMGAIEDPESALHVSCTQLRAAGTRLLSRAQAAGAARTDLDGTDLFALIAALAWLGDQPAGTSRLDHLRDVVTAAILPHYGSTATEQVALGERVGDGDGDLDHGRVDDDEDLNRVGRDGELGLSVGGHRELSTKPATSGLFTP